MTQVNSTQYRVASVEDIPRLKQLEQGVIQAERPFNSAIKDVDASYYDLQDLIENHNNLLLVGEYAGEIIASGYIKIMQSRPAFEHSQHGYLGFMFVDENFRGKGINQQLMQQLIDWAKQRGIKDFYLDVYADNEPAIKAYKKLGFRLNTVEMQLRL